MATSSDTEAIHCFLSSVVFNPAVDWWPNNGDALAGALRVHVVNMSNSVDMPVLTAASKLAFQRRQIIRPHAEFTAAVGRTNITDYVQAVAFWMKSKVKSYSWSENQITVWVRIRASIRLRLIILVDQCRNSTSVLI